MSKAIIVDLDGTLADIEHRVHFVKQSPKDWASFNKAMEEDKLNDWCAFLINAMSEKGHKLLFVTGRDDGYREETIRWLKKYKVSYDQLFMRKENDHRDDADIKEEIYLKYIKDQYSILFVLDDRLSVVRRWRELGLVCLQCDWGDF